VDALLGGLLRELAQDAELGPRLRAADTVVQFRLRDPEAQLTVRLRPDEPVRVDCGATELRPELVMTMAADLAHRFWLGQVSLTVALARGEIRATGPVARLLAQVPLLGRAAERYRARLVAAGRGDLL
jgi:hypothetical protein